MSQKTEWVPDLSVVLCTYNPREDYLRRALEGIRRQTLPTELWEFILVDNSSLPPMAGRLDLSGLPKSRTVVEKEPGLSHARRRGFQEAVGHLIVNLDDDIVLAPDYLANVIHLATEHPFLGVFGCQIQPEFEVAPRFPTSEYYAAERLVAKALWSNDPDHYLSHPWGAGSVVRKAVAEAYVERLARDQRFSLIGRKPGKLFACEDDDIAMTACEIGLGKGVFPSLCVTHLIQASKMTQDFQEKNAYGKGYSSTTLSFLKKGQLPAAKRFLARLNRLYRLTCMNSRRRREEIATARGVKDAIRDMRDWGWLENKS